LPNFWNSVESSAIDNPSSETAILWGKNLPQSIPLIWSFASSVRESLTLFFMAKARFYKNVQGSDKKLTVWLFFHMRQNH